MSNVATAAPGEPASQPDDLQRSLDRFRRKAAAVLNDESALRLLAAMYTSVVVETDDFDFGEHGCALAKADSGQFLRDRGQHHLYHGTRPAVHRQERIMIDSSRIVPGTR